MISENANSRGPLRFLFLLFACLMSIANYYCFDLVGILRNKFLEKLRESSGDNPEYIFNLLYTIYWLPIVPVPFYAGMVVDKFGYQLMNILFCFLILVGQALLYLGTATNSLVLMFAGRFVFGFGGESVEITIKTLLISWFKGKELSFSKALNLSFGRLGTVMCCFLSPLIAKTKLQDAILVASFIAAILFILSIITTLTERKYANIEPQVLRSDTIEVINSLKSFSKPYWLLLGLFCTLYLTVIPFRTIASSFFEEKWFHSSVSDKEYNDVSASRLISIIMVFSAITQPLVGYYVDKCGQRLKLLLISGFLSLLAHFLFLKIYPIIPLILLGIAYGLFSSVLWPTIVFLVPEDKVSSASGLAQSFLNLVFGLCPLLMAMLNSDSSSYSNVILLFEIFAILSICVWYLLMKEDQNHHISLDSNNQDALNSYIQKPYMYIENSLVENQERDFLTRTSFPLLAENNEL